jgi:hypothetical protein
MGILLRSRLTTLRLALACIGALLTLPAFSLRQPLHAQSAAQSVRLVIDYGEGVLKMFDRLPWSKGNTVLDVLNGAKGSPRGITFSYTGQGASAFLADIDGVTNQGGGPAARNWQYWVNTGYADRSFAVFEVQAMDTVFWRFTTAVGK